MSDCDDKAAIVRISPEFLTRLLQLPDGAYIDHVQMNPQMPGEITLRLRGAGWPVTPGCLIPHASPVWSQEVNAQGERLEPVVHWLFPS